MFIITKRKHDAIVENLKARIWQESDLADRYVNERDQVRAERDAETKRANELAVAKDAVLRDKLAADEKLKEMAGIERYAASLKPDALKYREKLRRDREAAAAKRKAKGGENGHG